VIGALEAAGAMNTSLPSSWLSNSHNATVLELLLRAVKVLLIHA
jgi:hypothetical protein